MDSAAEQADRLIRLVEHTRDLVLILARQIEGGGSTTAVAFAASVLHDMRPALAGCEETAGMLAAARRAGRTEGWRKGFADGYQAGQARPEEGVRRQHLYAVGGA